MPRRKQPKFTGLKKNHSAIFIGDKDSEGGDNRMRILNSRGTWTWTVFYGYAPTKTYNEPCWWVDEYSDRTNYARMRKYDKRNKNRKTIFLGYVRDTE